MIKCARSAKGRGPADLDSFLVQAVGFTPNERTFSTQSSLNEEIIITTIAYDYKQGEIAIDSRIACEGVINSDTYDKTIIHKDAVYFLTGRCADCETFVEGHNTANIKKELDCYAYMVKDKKVYLITLEDGAYKTLELKYNDAAGSGWKFALSALDFGKSAKEAVEYAMTRDNNTGGHVLVFSVAKNTWI